MYAPAEAEFVTPGGHPVTYAFRHDTNDWNTLVSTCSEVDEYELGGLSLTGWAMDIGGYLGSVGIGLAIDNPDLNVIIVEPVPDNMRLIRANALRNGLAQRVHPVEGAAGGPLDTVAEVNFGYRGEANLEHHAFVGNTTLVYEYGSNPGLEHDTAVVECYSLTDLLGLFDIDRLALLKIDCEGGEWGILTDPAVSRIDLIIGEWHPVLGLGSQARIVGLLPDHDVTFSGPEGGPGGFRATFRG
jgi:FkbM family methyltransferase